MILYHTGTGNSRLVALRLADILEDRVLRIDAYTPHAFRLKPLEKIVWVFPVYCWGIPPEVVRYIRSLQLENPSAVEQFMVCTCGDDVGLTAEQWLNEINKRGWFACGRYSIQMPNNYVLLPGFDVDPDDEELRKLVIAEIRTKEVGKKIMENSELFANDVVKGSMAWLKSRVLYPLFCRFLMSPKPFKATADCVGCGKCSRVCPRENIALNANHRPEWGGDCAMCLGCYHVCPHHAVAYGRVTRTKGQYFAPQEFPGYQERLRVMEILEARLRKLRGK